MQSRYAPYFFVAPFAILFCLFFAYPLGRSIMLSLYKAATPRMMQFVGLDNYRMLLKDRAFAAAVANTTYFALAFTLLQVPLSLGLALALNSRRLRFRQFFRFAFFSSNLVGNVFVAVIFSLLLAPRHGLINRAIGAVLPRVGTEVPWLSNPWLVMPAILMAALWLSVGFGMIYLLAALQGVDHELYEAAEVDGAGRWKKFQHVTLPSIAPVLRYLMLVGLIGAFQLFELPYVLFGQTTGPGGRAITVVMYLFTWGFEMGDIGYASAVGWALVMIIFLVTLMQFRTLYRAREAT